MPKLVLIHTVPPLIEVFNRLTKEMLPGVKVYHILDEVLLEQAKELQAGQASPQVDPHKPTGYLSPLDRLGDHLVYAENAGAEAVLVTCSTLSPLLRDLQTGPDIPVVRIDEAMIEKAVDIGERIGVLATNPPTLRPTREALEAEAADQNRPIELCTTLVEGAFQALMDGDARQHDRLVCEAIVRISADVDLVVLAQASMARALDGLPEAERPIPVLTSPHTALERVRKILEGKRR